MTGIFDRDLVAELVGDFDGGKLIFEKAIELFETVYMASRNLTPRTRVEYRNDIEQLADFLQRGGITKVAEVGLAHLQSFLAELDGRGLTGVTRRRKTASIKTFFGFLHNSGLIARNPTHELIPPEREYKEPRFLTTQEYQALQRACAHHSRDAATIELLLQTGMCLSEVARLTVDHIQLPEKITRDPANTGRIFVKGRGRRQRVLYLNYKACQALKAWLVERSATATASDALFLNKYLEKMSPRSIERVVEKYVEEAGIRHASASSLRHTFGTHHVAKGTDLRTVQEALGHADLRTTSVYVSTAKEAMRRALQDNAL